MALFGALKDKLQTQFSTSRGMVMPSETWSTLQILMQNRHCCHPELVEGSNRVTHENFDHAEKSTLNCLRKARFFHCGRN